MGNSQGVDSPEPLGWWTISGECFLDALRTVADGGDPDMVYAEVYANSEHHWYHGDDDAEDRD